MFLFETSYECKQKCKIYILFFLLTGSGRYWISTRNAERKRQNGSCKSSNKIKNTYLTIYFLDEVFNYIIDIAELCIVKIEGIIL